jgi:hypothetical protein
METIDSRYNKGSGSGSGSGYGSSSGNGDGSGSSSGYGYGFDDSDGDGTGSGSGYGSSSGSGSNSGSGSSSDSSYGDDNGDGSGSSYGFGFSSGSGSGSGSGSSYGSGDGSGDGGIVSFNGKNVTNIDDIPTIIYSTRGNISMGGILNLDMTITRTYIVNEGIFFAHGKTIKEALYSLQEKINNSLTIEERISNFKERFSSFTEEYCAMDLFEAHKLLTGSCLQGRESFCKNHNIDIESDKFTIYEFISLTKDSYGGSIILQLLA